MMNWDDIRIFLAIAGSETHKAAAKKLRIDQATVGRRIKEFESTLGAKLFDKRSDGFVLTEVGSQLLAQAKDVEATIAQMERRAASTDKSLSGIIRIAMPGGMANHWLIPRLGDFLKQYPDIRFEFLTGPEVINLWKREADLAIRLVEPKQKELFFKKIGDITLKLYRAKLRTKKSAPFHPKEDAFVGLFERATSAAEFNLLERIGVPQQVVLRTHAWSSVFYAVRSGLGVGILPSFFQGLDDSLEECDDSPEVKTPVWMVMHPDVKGTGRVKALTEFIAKLSKEGL